MPVDLEPEAYSRIKTYLLNKDRHPLQLGNDLITNITYLSSWINWLK